MIFLAVDILESNNIVYKIIRLILLFCCVTGILIFNGVDFLAFLMLIIYGGAIGVLFAFIVMMLDLKEDNSELQRYNFLPYLSFALSLIYIFYDFLSLESFVETIYYYFKIDIAEFMEYGFAFDVLFEENNEIDYPFDFEIGGIHVFGQGVYNFFYLGILVAGFCLLVAMIGSIVITQSKK